MIDTVFNFQKIKFRGPIFQHRSRRPFVLGPNFLGGNFSRRPFFGTPLLTNRYMKIPSVDMLCPIHGMAHFLKWPMPCSFHNTSYFYFPISCHRKIFIFSFANFICNCQYYESEIQLQNVKQLSSM